MHNNHLYNLLLQLTEEQKSHWRIKKEYAKDAGSCKECKAFWKKLGLDKERHVHDLTRIIKNHIK